MTTKIGTLERPRAVQMASAVLILTPVLDIITMQRTGTQVFSWVSWLFVFGAGISLLIRHKLAWVIGVALCCAFVTSTGVSLFKSIGTVSPVVSAAMLLDCLLVVFIVGTVFSLFRYPYLDRRQNWFAPTGERFQVRIPFIIDGVTAQSVDLSYTGVRLDLSEAERFKMGDLVPLQIPDIDDIQCHARVISSGSSSVRVHFEQINAEDKALLREWLASQNLKKV